MGGQPVIIKSNRYGMTVRLRPDLPFPELLEAVADKFRASAQFFRDAVIAVTFQGRDLTAEEERLLVDTIMASSELQIACVTDGNPEREETFRLALEKARAKEKAQLEAEAANVCNGQFFRGHLLSGDKLEFPHSVVLLGDVQPGASITSRGNVVVLGSCRGNVYAGADGNRACYVAALVMKPIQIRIADKMARSAITKRSDSAYYALDPKIAFIKDDHIYVKSLVRSTLNEILETTAQTEGKEGSETDVTALPTKRL